MNKAWEHIQEIESLGGMSKAIETGIPKMRIEEAAARRQARIDSGIETIVGVNKYKLEHEDQIEILEVDNTSVRKSQIKRLEKLRAARNKKEVQEALDALKKVAENKTDNLLALSIEAARRRATLGEISLALEKVFGRHKAVTRSISGVYCGEYSNGEEINKARAISDEFEKI